MTEPLVSVIVLNWNGKKFLSKCLGSLLEQDYPNYEVLLVDNGSTDGSIEFVKERLGKNSRLRLIALDENYGFAKGNNIGIKYAHGKYVIILNNDTEVKRSFIRKLVKTAKSDDQIGSVTCKILSTDSRLWFSQKFTNRGFIVPFFLQNLTRDRIRRISNVFRSNIGNAGCAVLYKKSVLNKIGYYDEDFWSNWEDYDLGYRINIAGFKSIYIPLPLVLHVGGGSEGFSPDRYVRIYRNMLLTYFKNYESKNLLVRFLIFLFLLLPLHHLGWIVSHILFYKPEFEKRKSYQYVFSLVKAYTHFMRRLRHFVEKRVMIQKLRKDSDKQIFSRTKTRYIV
ncbi:MAG: glycosyltransferase family 2 protein [Promethearchaeota archaeon]